MLSETLCKMSVLTVSKDTVDIVDIVDTVDIVDIVDTVDTVDTVDSLVFDLIKSNNLDIFNRLFDLIDSLRQYGRIIPMFRQNNSLCNRLTAPKLIV